MSTEHHHITVSDIDVEIVRKDIKNLHLAVYPPSGHVRIAVPLHISNDAARLAVVSRLRWIQKKRKSVSEQVRESELQMASGESHYVGGRRYLLEVVYRNSVPSIEIVNNKKIRLFVRPNTSVDGRKNILYKWYRDRLGERIPKIVKRFETKLDVKVDDWNIRKMKTRWGSCKPECARITVNIELGKKSDTCLEYIVMHEMIHLLERNHSERFFELMDKNMPNWKIRRDELNQSPLAYEDWVY